MKGANRTGRLCWGIAAMLLAVTGTASGAPPGWLKALAGIQLPEQDPDLEAVKLYSEVELVVADEGRMRKRVRAAFRILSRDGRDRALLRVPQDSWTKVLQMRGWAIPVSGKSTDVRTSDVIETSIVNVQGGELITDLRMKVLQIPGAEPGVTVGYEYELAVSNLELADLFPFQDTIPVREARYLLQLPAGWSMTSTWLNHSGVPPEMLADQKWSWTLRDVPQVNVEAGMPSWPSVAGQLFLALSPHGAVPQLSTWEGIGGWFVDLSRDRRVVSTQIRATVEELLSGKQTQLEKIRQLAAYVQSEIRYVGVQLGIGGFQPHAATDVLRNRYGDCKDKVTLLSVMLAEAGIESVPVLVNTDRSRVSPESPPSLRFDHVVLAIRLPQGKQEDGMLAMVDTTQGALLIFDPTDELTPFGRIPGSLQGSYGLLALEEGSHLVQLPRQMPGQAGNRRTGRLVLDGYGRLAGEIQERVAGAEAAAQRGYLRAVRREIDRAEPVRARLAESLATFRLESAEVANQEISGAALEWKFRFVAESYARRADDLLILRPRVLGITAFNLAEEDQARKYDLMLSEPHVDSDEFLIDLPAGYEVESLPPPVDLDLGFAAYRSVTEVTGAQLRYVRAYEVRDLRVPAASVEDFRRMHREIARDERARVVLKPSGP